MMRRKVGLLSFALALSMLFGGCGTTMYELTKSEEEVIVDYAAYAVAKHNIFQKDGVQVLDEKYFKQETQEPEDPKDEQEDTQGVSQGNGTQATVDKLQEEEISLADAIGQSGVLDVWYQGYEVTNSYQEGAYYSIDATDGKTYVVMDFTMKNVTSSAVTVDILSLEPTFRACFNGKDWVTEEMTLLLYGLSTYEGELKAGEQVDVVLIFQISDDIGKQISDIKLSVERDGKTSPINL